MRFRILVTLLCLITITSVWADTKKSKNILSLKETITDNDIRFPSSFNESNDMMKDWYNLYHETNTPIDQQNDGRYGNVSDNVYKERLQKLPTSIEMPFNQIVKSYIERYVVKGRSMVSNLLGMSNYYMPIFEAALARHGMPLELKYIPIIESALNPNAVSPAGAGGLWQFMPATAKGHGMEVNNTVDQRRDPYVASEKAAVFFQKLYNTYGDWSLAIAAYNCGPGNVNKAIKRTGNDQADFWEIYNYLPKETRGYVPAFIAANYVMTYYKDHGITPQKTRDLVVDTVMVKRRVTFSQISRVLNIPIEEIRILNPQYRGDVIPGNVHPYYLALPSQLTLSYIDNENKIIGGSGYTNTNSNSTAFIDHVVNDGESIYDISDQYGITVDDILLLNKLQTAEEIKPGMQLKVINNGKKKATNKENPQNTQDDDNDDDNGDNGDIVNNGNNSQNQGFYLDDDDEPNYNRSHHTGSDNRRVPVSQRRKVEDKPEVPTQPKKEDNSSYNQNYEDNGSYGNDDDDYEEELRRQEEARKKEIERQKELERKKKAAEEAKKRAAERKKKEAEEAAKKKAAEKKKREAELAEKKKKEAELAEKKKKEAEEAAKKKKEAEEAAKKKAAEEAARKKAAEEAAKPINHKVQDGENLIKIAKRYGTTPQKIKQANGLKDDNIRSGATLKIPKK